MGEQKVAVVTGGSAGIGEVASLPPHVNIDTLGIMPADQAER